MLSGLLLLYVGAVLCLNGLWMADFIHEREIVPINLATGTIALAVAGYMVFGPDANDETVAAAAMTLLFSITYFWVAWNRMTSGDGRGLGWFSLFVAITVLPVAWSRIAAAEDGFALWLGLNWVAWSALWATYFVALTLRLAIRRTAAAATLAAGVLTGWIPGVMILNNMV
ncbi:AmiS/UreI family transporter [Jannaschia rubra]|uniref:Urease accessory protein UreI n=1 Tax=Jannaschia rubra TaxID=282197 RepID=A0A0M6XQF2_9RHOB|nr:AmiS/UreI family transporter [Jannaschia rubra]CTQ32264.1 Urease accessory protein UreI [Jannaschia rubra]SFG48703.1 AmiS/UreI family transporter [Jannaschia rubra]